MESEEFSSEEQSTVTATEEAAPAAEEEVVADMAAPAEPVEAEEVSQPIDSAVEAEAPAAEASAEEAPATEASETPEEAAPADRHLDVEGLLHSALTALDELGQRVGATISQIGQALSSLRGNHASAEPEMAAAAEPEASVEEPVMAASEPAAVAESVEEPAAEETTEVESAAEPSAEEATQVEASEESSTAEVAEPVSEETSEVESAGAAGLRLRQMQGLDQSAAPVGKTRALLFDRFSGLPGQRHASPVTFAPNHVDHVERRDDVRELAPDDHPCHRVHVGKTGRAAAALVGFARAVADYVKAKLAVAAFNREI